MPAMPHNVHADVQSALTEIAWAFANLERDLANDAQALDRIAQLFVVSQKASAPLNAIQVLDRAGLLGGIVGLTAGESKVRGGTAPQLELGKGRMAGAAATLKATEGRDAGVVADDVRTKDTPREVAEGLRELEEAVKKEIQAEGERTGRAPQDGEECLYYAQRRWGFPAWAHAGGSNPGAFNIVFEGNDATTNKPKSSVRRLEGVSDYTTLGINEGDGLVWDSVSHPVRGGFDNAYGHIAVIEQVWSNQILVSEANRPPGTAHFEWYKRDLLDQRGVYVLPKGH